MAPSWLAPALGAAGLLLSAADPVSANQMNRMGASPSYQNIDACPVRCNIAGPNPSNWSIYPSFKSVRACHQTMFFDFSIFDPVDQPGPNHRIAACSSYGPDWSNTEAPKMSVASGEPVNATYELGWWEEGFGLAPSNIRSLIKQTRQYLNKGHGPDDDEPTIMYAQTGQTTIGLYIGAGLQNQNLGAGALKQLEDTLTDFDVKTPSIAMQYCGPDSDSDHVFGLLVSSNGTFTAAQDAIKTWRNATCLPFTDSQSVAGTAMFTTPLIKAADSKNATVSQSARLRRNVKLNARGECTSIQVKSGDTCGKLASRCGVTGHEFEEYNSADDFCASLMPQQHVCCSKGDLPDFRPKPNSDGSCHSYKTKKGDNCDAIAAANSLEREDLEDFNKDTWGWSGCERLFAEVVMCLSSGSPPFPAPISNAKCGPQVPGTEAPDDDTDIAELNPCPLNSCCDIWGQCGITDTFCIDTNTGPPGTAEEGTFGCISNCGTDIVKGNGGGDIRIGYFEGYGLGRKCLFQDAFQIAAQDFTHLQFAFGTLTPDYQVETGDILSSYEFKAFKQIAGPKRVLSFGGWAFSTEPATYSIFRQGVTAANRLTMAKNIAKFIHDHGLDGVDIDWEYPGAPDIPGIPPASEDDGKNYLAFLAILKNLLPGKSVSIAAPSSYWYLKQYPIDDIAKVVDYIVFMTYDLHGQWDTNNANSQEGCDNGNCLRSQVNLTETKNSLAMITKAGVPGEKVVVGVTSYGRSFNMAEAGCYGPDCLYTGSRTHSDATKGECTDTAGYIADAEIREIVNDGYRVNKKFLDKTSNSDILIYDDTQWVAYMTPETKAVRAKLYAAWGMAGTTDWATDLESYNDVPSPAEDWPAFKLAIKQGKDPRLDDVRTGNWTDLHCTHDVWKHPFDYSPADRWEAMDTDDAWADVVRTWKEVGKGKGLEFTEWASYILDSYPMVDCGEIMETSNCVQTADCKLFENEGTGPAAAFLWNSFVIIHEMFTSYHTALFDAASSAIGPALDDFENKFAPIPPEPDNTWLLFLIDIITVGAATAAGPFFNSFLSKLPYFLEKGVDNIKDTTMTLIGQSTTIAKDLLDTPESDWSEESQDEFSNYMGQTITAWGNVSSVALQRLFNGEDDSLELLGDLISDGKMIAGSKGNPKGDAPDGIGDTLQADIAKAFFGYSIPALWKLSKTYAFVIDSGASCSSNDDCGSNPIDDYLEDDTAKNTCACYKGTLYYVVEPDGDSNECHCVYTHNHCDKTCVDQKFSVPPGLDSLDGTNFGGITPQDLVIGSVRTWLDNGKENGGASIDPSNDGTLDDLMDVDVTTPGLVRLPVCTPERAFQSWDTTDKGSSENYPCDIPPGKDKCGDSSFENQTSDASPPVDDCLQIIKNIEGDGGTEWTTQVVGKNQRKIAQAGECKFGVEATKVNGNVNFKVGGQDVIDIINESIKRFGGGGKVGAKGDMSCDGNIHGQDVKWGLY